MLRHIRIYFNIPILCMSVFSLSSSLATPVANNFVIPDEFVGYSDDDSSLVFRIPLDVLRAIPKYQTALHLQYQKRIEDMEKAKAAKNNQKPNQKPSKPKQKEKIRKFLEELDSDNFNLFKAAMSDEITSLDSRSIIPLDPATKFQYFSMTTDLTDAKGNIELNNSIATNFSVDATDVLMLNLKDGSTLNLRTDVDVILKSGDVINVIGTGNKINITKGFNFNGSLCFDANAELEIIFSRSSATISFKPGMQIDLEAGNEFKIHGNGSIIMNDNSVINFKNLNNMPSLILEDSASLNLTGKTLFKGTGIFQLQDEAELNFATSSGGTLIVGNSINDYFEFTVSHNSLLNIKGDDYVPSSYSFLYFAYGQTFFNVNNGGTIIIGNKGKLGINQTQGGILARGIFYGFNLVPTAKFYLQPGGELSITPNNKEYNPVSGNNFMTWSGDATVVFGGADAVGKVGIVSYVSPNSSYDFAGQMVLANGNFVTPLNGISSEILVRALVNRSRSLITATQLLDANNVDWIRLSNGKIIQMETGDVIVEENKDGSVRGRNGRTNILFTLSGIREVYRDSTMSEHCN